MKASIYLQDHFPGLKLMPSLYQQWDIGIHFTLAEEIYQFDEQKQLNMDRFERVYEQAIILFKALFASDDQLLLVTNMYKKAENVKRTKKLKVYQHHLKQHEQIYQLQVETLPYPFDVEDADQFALQQFSLRCQCHELHVGPLIKAAIHEDFPLKPRLGGYKVDYPDVFFINLTRNIIFFIYDDRGCEVIARNVQDLRPLYENYQHLIGEMDREEINRKLGY